MNVYFIDRGIFSNTYLTYKYTLFFHSQEEMSMAQAVLAHTLSSVLNYLDISPFRSLNFWHLIQAICLQMIHA